MPDYSATQKRILGLLSDGRGHTKSDIFKCLNDQSQSIKAVSVHLAMIRKKLRPIGQDIQIRYETSNGGKSLKTTYVLVTMVAGNKE